MIRALALVGALVTLGAAGAQAQTAPAPVPIALPHPPPVADQTSRLVFDAMLAISRAQATNPGAAQAASFAYYAALQQYRIGNFGAARTSALQALSTASTPAQPPLSATPAPVPALVPGTPAQVPGLAGGLYGADAPAIDADSFLALARGTLDACAARHDPRLKRAQASYDRATADFAARNWQATRLDAKAAIDACAQAAAR